MIVLAISLLVAGAPRSLRWEASRSAFDRLAADFIANPDVTTPDRVGLYYVERPLAVPGGFIVYENSPNGFFDDAGFAYLPAGPTSDLGDGAWENPQFHHLGGPWYSWTASW